MVDDLRFIAWLFPVAGFCLIAMATYAAFRDAASTIECFIVVCVGMFMICLASWLGQIRSHQIYQVQDR